MQIQKVKTQQYQEAQVNIDDLVFHIQFLLQMSRGSELVAALGFPHESSNDAAVKKWVKANLILYYKKEKSEMAYDMAEAISNKAACFFNENWNKTVH